MRVCLELTREQIHHRREKRKKIGLSKTSKRENKRAGERK
jgi:hypothetical protein